MNQKFLMVSDRTETLREKNKKINVQFNQLQSQKIGQKQFYDLEEKIEQYMKIDHTQNAIEAIKEQLFDQKQHKEEFEA